MKIDGTLFDFAPAPNPRRVRIYLAEKGVEIDRQEVNIIEGNQNSDEFKAKNMNRQIPVLELPDGTCISESIAICRYVEAIVPNPPLFGTDPVSIATIDMWLRRVDLNLMFNIGQVWVHGHSVLKNRLKQIPEAADRGREATAIAYARFNDALADQQFIAGDSYTIADVAATATVEFGCTLVGVPFDDSLTHLARWFEQMKARPSFGA